MNLTGDGDTIRSDTTEHTATRHDDHWTVSWLGDRKLSNNEAVTAIVLAESVAQGKPQGDKLWVFIDGWAEELGLNRHEAVTMILGQV